MQIMIEASTFSGARYKIHNMFQEKGMPVFKVHLWFEIVCFCFSKQEIGS